MVTPLCILLVDESKFFLELERQFLRNTPATTLLASTAVEALELARTYRPSLIYLDMKLPDMDGSAFCLKIRADRELATIPVILVGAQGSDDEALAQAAGASAFISKPLDRRVFLGVGHSFLLSIDRREPRRTCRIPVSYLCRGQRLQGHCIDISSGGMFLDCLPVAGKGEGLLLRFALPDANLTEVELHGRIAWANSDKEIIKPDYPHGYGIEFIDISEATGTLLRRCFGARSS